MTATQWQSAMEDAQANLGGRQVWLNRGLAKNTSRLHLLFALSNLYQVRLVLLATA